MELKSIGLEYAFRSNNGSVHLSMMPVVGVGLGSDDKTRLRVGVGMFAEPEQGKLTVSGPAGVVYLERNLLAPTPVGPLAGAFVGVSAHAGSSPESGATTSGVLGTAGLFVAYATSQQTLGAKLDFGMPIVSGGTRPVAPLSAGLTFYLGLGF